MRCFNRSAQLANIGPLLFVFWFCGTAAHAALVDQGTTTLDDVSLREWLDLTETQGLSANQFLADQGGFISAGYQLATVEDVQGLLGQLFDPFPDDTGFVPVGFPTNELDNVNTALTLFGQTDGNDQPFGEGVATDSLGLSFTGLCQPFYQKDVSSGATRVGSFCVNANVGPDDTPTTANFGFGIWAYRNVPIPAVAWLFPAGLIAGLGWMRVQQKA